MISCSYDFLELCGKTQATLRFPDGFFRAAVLKERGCGRLRLPPAVLRSGFYNGLSRATGELDEGGVEQGAGSRQHGARSAGHGYSDERGWNAASGKLPQVVLTGEAGEGQQWRAAFGQGWAFRVLPIQPGPAGYSGWDLVVDREQPAGYPDALLLATPPYNSINEREVGTPSACGPRTRLDGIRAASGF